MSTRAKFAGAVVAVVVAAWGASQPNFNGATLLALLLLGAFAVAAAVSWPRKTRTRCPHCDQGGRLFDPRPMRGEDRR
jgi:peptidoglycan/LPS O-acetylase OafA/YrhL